MPNTRAIAVGKTKLPSKASKGSKGTPKLSAQKNSKSVSSTKLVKKKRGRPRKQKEATPKQAEETIKVSSSNKEEETASNPNSKDSAPAKLGAKDKGSSSDN